MKNTNLIIGKINTGKTNTMFNELDKLIENEENLLIVDIKEEYYSSYINKLTEKGYDTHIVNLKNSKKSNGFNPLLLPYNLYKNGYIDESLKLVKNIAIALFKNENKGDLFWINMASDYFVGLTIILFENGKPNEINLGSVYMMASKVETDYINDFKEYLKKVNVTTSKYIFLSGTVFSANDTRAGIVSVFKSEINKYVSYENLSNLLYTNELDLQKLKDKFAIIIISNEDYSGITSNIIDEISSIENIKVNYILDNFDSLSPIVSLNKILENANYKNEKIYIITRNIERLFNNYDKFILDKIENTVNCSSQNTKNKTRKEYKKYPILESKKHCYFNIERIFK